MFKLCLLYEHFPAHVKKTLFLWNVVPMDPVLNGIPWSVVHSKHKRPPHLR